MRTILTLVITGIILFSTGAYGQTPSELSYRFLPNQIVENTDAVLQVYAKDNAFTGSIDNLIATSSDSSKVQILGIEKEENNFIIDVKIKALTAGTTNIDLAAPGFMSQEIPITVYSDNKAPTKLLIKTTPNTFSTIGATTGYVSVELSNDAGVPIKARADTTITLTTTDSNIINLKNTELVIKTGEYYAIGEFEVKKDGTAQLSASASSTATVSSTITVSTVETLKTVQLYVFPKILNNYQNSYGYVIAQLQQNGVPVQATEDVTLPIQVTDSSGIVMKNTSGENPTASANQPIVIKKGSYWGYTKISVAAGQGNATWNVGLNAKGYILSSPVKITTASGQLLDDHTAILDLLPVLATGQKELIGIMHLEDDTVNPPNPVIAKSGLVINVDSSDPNTLSVDNVIMDKGSEAALVFGQVGNTVSTPPSLHVVTEGPSSISQTYTPTITVPTPNPLTFVADPLIPVILENNDFPLALYVTKDGAINYFPKDLNTFISPKDIFQTESKTLPQGESIVLLNSKSLKDGSSTITISAGDFTTNLSLISLTSKPTTIALDYPTEILSNLKNTFSIQLLDDQHNPVFLDQDTQFKLVSSDPTVLNVPESVVIKKGEYYSLFNVDANKAGMTQLSVLTSDLPLSKFSINVITNPNVRISISSNDYVNPNSDIDAAVIAQYNTAPLSGLKVDWNVQGAKIQKMESITNNDGKAMISLTSEDPNKISIAATVSGGTYGTTTVNKDITVNQPLEGSTQTAASGGSQMTVLGINPLFIIIPVAAGVGGFFVLKKKNMLEGITEKVGFVGKFSEIKERLSGLKE